MQFIIYNVDRHTNPQHYAQILEYNGYKISMIDWGTDIHGDPSYRWVVDIDSAEDLVKISDIIQHRLVITSKNFDAYNWATNGKYNILHIYDDYLE